MAKRSGILLAAAALFASTACVKKDYPADAKVVSAVDLSGTKAVDGSEVLEGMATAKSPRFLGVWDGVGFEYEVFDPALLDRDLERIERYYRARGYYEAKVTAARVVPLDEHHVRVEIRVEEGAPVLIAGDVRTNGIERLPFDAALAAEHACTLRPGDRFDEGTYASAKANIARALADRGYAFVRITAAATVDISRHEARVAFQVEPGPRAVYGPVRITGLTDVPEGPVRANLDLSPGKPYSRAEVDDARAALVNLGIFTSVDVKQDLSRPESGVVPITVTVEEAPLRTLRMGGGMRFDVLEWSSNLTVGWEHRNFLGGMRRLSLETRPGVVFYPTRMDNFAPPRNVLPRSRVRAELHQPSFLEGRTTGFVSVEYNVYPVLFPGLGETQNANENVIGYQELKTRAGAERAFFGHHLYVTPSYNWQANFPFAYIGTNPLRTVHVSYPELGTVLDFRDDPIEPHRGLFVSNTVQVAGHIFGGDTSDVKEQPEIRTYVPISKTVTFATRATVGFLFAANYGSTLSRPAPGASAPAADQDAWRRDQQLLLFRAFYSGGPNSNRGYPFRGVGPQGVLGYLLPSTAACEGSTSPPQSCFRPLGGLTLWEASAELRFPLFGPLRMALFVDASDVVREIRVIRFTYPHLSPGFGLRYATPVGPFRLDVGYRIPYAQEVGVQTIADQEGTHSTVFGLPIAVHFGLGEAY